jgi:hypothetical protein
MNARTVLVGGLLLCLSLAGCAASKSHGTESGSESISPTSTGTGGPHPPLINSTYAKNVHWNDCEGWQTGFTHPPGEPAGASHDPEWANPQIGLFTTVVMYGRECQRVSWGPFERPVRMILEHHNFLAPPVSCEPDANTTRQITKGAELASIWVNDTELADYLKATYPGMPVFYSPMQSETRSTGGLLAHTWTWGLGKQNQSRVTILDDQIPGGYYPHGIRLFWYSSEGVSFMDLVSQYQNAILTDRTANGTLYPPMLWGYVAQPFAYAGQWTREITMEGDIHAFRDHQCKEPA